MNQKLYLECYAGISGDMMVGALLDLGADEDKLRKTLESLKLDGYAVEVSRVKKSGLDVCDFAVKLDAEHENHDHDMGYLLAGDAKAAPALPGDAKALAGDAKAAPALTRDTQDNIHDHEEMNHHHHHHHHAHSHMHRGLPEILEILDRSAMTDCAKVTAKRIFQILAKAEAKAHGVALEEVHFHEVGAVDSIVDIAAAAICLDDLGITDVIVPALYEGCGSIHCQHGEIPVPVPATLNIVSAHHLRLCPTGIAGEFVTPTGAAIAAAICTEYDLPKRYTVEKTGLGAGKRSYERPSILRAMLIMPEQEDTADTIVKLECNLDDCTGETLGYAMERLFAAGARDVFYTPVFMKKNRPGYLLSLLCAPEDVDAMEEILFSETSTIGVRRACMERSVLVRRIDTVQTKEGTVQVKTVRHGDVMRRIPEYESVAEIARKRKQPFRDLYKRIEAELNETAAVERG